jgi:hypothetical protein
MSVRSTVLATALGLVCSLVPLTSIPADAAVADAATRLESLLTAHDVRNVIHAHDVRDAIQAPRARSSDCLHTEAERGR